MTKKQVARLNLVDVLFERALAIPVDAGVKRPLVLGRALHIIARHLEMHEGEEDAGNLLIELGDAIKLGLFREGRDRQFPNVKLKHDKGDNENEQ